MTYSLSFARVFSSWRTSGQESHASTPRRSAHDEGLEKHLRRNQSRQMRGWIGVDLDGTLAYYDGWKGPGHIGKPVPAMAKRVRMWLEEGREVRIFTARACEPERVHYVEAWCETHFGVRLPVTNVKDFGMRELWDDRCVPVQANTGQVVSGFSRRHS